MKMKSKVILFIIIVIFFSILLIYYYSFKISPVLLKYAKIEGKKQAIDIISKNLSDDIVECLNDKELFTVEKDNNGNIEMIDYNTKVVNKILSITSKQVTNNFSELEKKNNSIIKKIPMGIITNNVFFDNLGPKIPIKMELDGNVLTSLKTKVKNYGVNSALIEVYVNIEANVDIIIPFCNTKIKVTNEVPISIKVAKGNVSSILNTE